MDLTIQKGTGNDILVEVTPSETQFVVIDRGIQGATGATGAAATIAVGATTTLAAGSPATVANSGTSAAAVFNFGIPEGIQGVQGVQGVQGIQGATGTAATVAVGTTSTLAAGSSATVANTGTSAAAVFDFGIPEGIQGIQGIQGATGTAATIAVGTTSTIAAGSPATVTNVGTSAAAVFDFGIPEGAAGTGDVSGAASSTDNAIARFDGTTGKIIQNSAVTIADDGATVIAANSTTNGLRITQLGAGNALVVEDSANPDSTPFVVAADGKVIIGATASDPLLPAGFLQSIGDGVAPNFSIVRYQTGSGLSTSLVLLKANGTKAAPLTVNSGDRLGTLNFNGYDGTAFIESAFIRAEVDGTPSTNDMPARLVFSTTADGASTPTERMRIDSTGAVGIGTTSLGASYGLRVSKTFAGDNGSNIFSSATGTASTPTGLYSFRSTIATGANGGTPYTIASAYSYTAAQGTFNADSTVTNQFGFRAESNLTGATNNYGFYSVIPSGTGDWNFYAAGTADNYFAGALGLGSVPIAGVVPLNIGYTLTGGTNVSNVRAIPTIASDVTFSATVFRSQPYTQAAAFTLSSLIHYNATQGTFGATSAVINQYGFFADAGLTGATNNYGFFGNIASGTGRFNFYASGTAANVFVGTTSIGGAVGAESLRVTPVASAVNYVTAFGGSTGNAPVLFAQGSDTNISLTYATTGTGAHLFNTGGNAQNQFRIAHTASAVNYMQVTGNATTGAPILSAQGTDANVSVLLLSKGIGGHVLSTGSTSNIQLVVANTTSAVNYLQLSGAATGGQVQIASNGTDTNVAIGYNTKGAGQHFFYSNATPQFNIANTASAVNYLRVAGAVTTGAPVISAQGSDTNIGLTFTTKGTGSIVFNCPSTVFAFGSVSGTDFTNYFTQTGSLTYAAAGSSTDINFVFAAKGAGNLNLKTGGGTQFLVANTASAVNYLQTTGAATGVSPAISAQGSDTNIDLKLTPKGTGVLSFGTYTAGILAQAGYITIKDAAGNTRNLLVG